AAWPEGATIRELVTQSHLRRWARHGELDRYEGRRGRRVPTAALHHRVPARGVQAIRRGPRRLARSGDLLLRVLLALACPAGLRHHRLPGAGDAADAAGRRP